MARSRSPHAARGKRTNLKTQIEMAWCVIMEAWGIEIMTPIEIAEKAANLADEKSTMSLSLSGEGPVFVITPSPALTPLENAKDGTKQQYANHVKYLAERIKAQSGKKAIPLRPKERNFVHASVIYGLEMLRAEHVEWADEIAEKLHQIGWSKFQARRLMAFAAKIHKNDESWQLAAGHNATADYRARWADIYALAQTPFVGITLEGFQRYLLKYNPMIERFGGPTPN
jgi:hypothetical protein